MDAFPTDADSARIAATVYRAAGKLNLSASAAQKWRDRSPADPVPADRAIAEIRLAAGDAPGALQALDPYAKEVIAKPASNPGMFATLLRAYVLAGRDAEAKKALEPLLPQEARWRTIWLQLAADDVKDADTAIAWVKEVAPHVPASDPGEQTALATAWYQISVRTRDRDANEEAARVLDPVVKQSNAPGGAVLLRAAVAERDGDFKTAEELYRRGLKLLPDQPESLNNLAYLILLRGGDLNEAKGLADKAVQIAPQTAGFYDTLGRILAKQGDRDAAIANFHTALRVDPNNLEALIGLASTLCDAGKRESAMSLMPQIDTAVRSRPGMSAALRKELDAVRSAVKASL
jgi:tetratricopeptide (TPR) repeat protein